jgi:hypothetical protein
MRVLSVLVVLGVLLAGLRAAPGEAKKKSFNVISFITAQEVGFDRAGRCVAKKHVLKAWRMKDYPAKIEHFESCVTLSSPDKRGRMDFNASIVATDDTTLLEVDGRIDLGSQGRVSQQIAWDELEVLQAGKYFIVLTVDEDEVGRFPIYFEKTGRGR